MSKTDYYCQCRLQKGNRHQTSFIPFKFAHVGEILKLRNDKGIWEDGWVVVVAGEPFPALTVEIVERDHLRHRKQSDI